MNSEESINASMQRQQLQRVYSEIIHGNLAEFKQEQVYGKCENYWFCCTIDAACCAFSEIYLKI
jgi:hypothetical protein